MEVVTTTESRQSLYDLLAENYAPAGDAYVLELDLDDRYCLVEHNIVTGEYWLTVLADLDAVAHYHLHQERSEDWQIVEVVDLDNGECYEPEHTIRFTPTGQRYEDY